MKIGFIQFAPALGRIEETIRKAAGMIEQAGDADLLVLPELCNSGYNFSGYEQAWDTSEDIERSIFLDSLVSKCKEFDLCVVTGFNERDREHLYNTAVLVGPEGFIGKYRKIHLFMNEKDFFQPGDSGLPVFEVGAMRLGLLVCFDWVFPEVWRILALKGADIICHPSNLVLPGLAQRAVPIHALINHVYTVTANRIGSEGDLTFTGLSTIADPLGNNLHQASRTGEEIGIVDIDPALARNKMVTPRNDIFEDRRPELYGLLAERVTTHLDRL